MCLYPISVTVRPKSADWYSQEVSCGKCLECLRQKSLEWAFRILDECSLHSENCFLTLTYNDDFLPSDKSVRRFELSLFMKRLRKALAPLKVRFFGCGEYGSRFLRPHYHVIIFGWYPQDAYFFQRKDDVDLFRSPLLERCWKFGFSTVGKVDFKSALYCAKYMNKYQFDYYKSKNRFPAPVRPPFVQMSNRPGIGYGCVYRCDLRYDRIYRNGRSVKIPRYYLKVMERDGIYLDEFKERRQFQGELVARSTDINVKRSKFKDIF